MNFWRTCAQQCAIRNGRNHFDSKSRRGTEVAAIFYTLIETAKLVGVEPAAYLSAAVRAADLGETLLPVDFAAA